MTIAYFVTDLGRGGTQAWVEYAARELIRRGHRITVVAERVPHNRATGLRGEGIEVHAFDKPQFAAVYADILKASKTEVLHLSVWENVGQLVRLREVAHIPVVLSYQHVPKVSLHAFVGRFLAPTARRWGRGDWFSLSEARMVVDAHAGCCQALARGIRLKFWPFLQSRIFALCNAIPMPALEEQAELPESLHFVQVGALIDRKDPGLTLEAFAAVAREQPEARLTFVGDGPLRADLEHRRDQLRLFQVSFAGAADDPSPWYAAASVAVLPSLCEGLPYALLEAAASGISLIASSVDGNPEICRHGINGLLVKPRDQPGLERAMLRMARSAETRRNMGEEGRRFVQRDFNIVGCVDRLLDIYNYLIRNNTRNMSPTV